MNAPIRKFDDLSESLNLLSGEIVDCAFKVHQQLGPGFLENIYEEALCIELKKKNIHFEKQKPFKIKYDNQFLSTEFRFDLVVEEKILLELKAVKEFHPLHMAQIYAYLSATQYPLGLLINFNVPLIKDGIKRIKLRNSEPPREIK